MLPDKNNPVQQDSANDQLLQSGKDNLQNGVPAHEAAEADIQSDPDLNGVKGVEDDLDEGELAKLEGKQ